MGDAGSVQAWCQSLASLLFSCDCVVCGGLLAAPSRDRLCAGCVQGLYRIETAVCTRCGHPMPGVEQTSGGRAEGCWNCRGLTLSFSRVWGLYAYAGLVRELLHRFKYDRHVESGVVLRELFRSACAGLEEALEGVDVILPVPLHITRLRERGLNQAWYLSRGLPQALRRKCRAGVLWRKVPGTKQSTLGREERLQNLGEVIAVRERKARCVRGKRCLLVDDVLTTGATAEACARALRAAGAREVQVLVLCRAL